MSHEKPQLRLSDPCEIMPGMFKDGDMRQLALGDWLNRHGLTLSAWVLECYSKDTDTPLVLVAMVEKSPDGKCPVICHAVPLESMVGCSKRTRAELYDFHENGEHPVFMVWQGLDKVDECTLNGMLLQLEHIMGEPV